MKLAIRANELAKQLSCDGNEPAVGVQLKAMNWQLTLSGSSDLTTDDQIIGST